MQATINYKTYKSTLRQLLHVTLRQKKHIIRARQIYLYLLAGIMSEPIFDFYRFNTSKYWVWKTIEFYSFSV